MFPNSSANGQKFKKQSKNNKKYTIFKESHRGHAIEELINLKIIYFVSYLHAIFLMRILLISYYL